MSRQNTPLSSPRPPAGSTADYALHRCPPAQRDSLAALWDLHAQLRGILRLSSLDAAQAKLAWWAGQISELDGGTAQHPLLRTHGPAWQRSGVGAAILQGVVEGVAIDLRQNRWIDAQALLHYAHHSGGDVLRASALLLGLGSAEQQQAARALGAGMRLVLTLRHLGRDLAQGRLYLPMSGLQRHALTASELLRPDLQMSPALSALLREQAQLARERLLAGRAVWQDAPADRAAPLRSLAATHAALLDEIERSGFAVLDRSVALTPLRKLWISRTARWR